MNQRGGAKRSIKRSECSEVRHYHSEFEECVICGWKLKSQRHLRWQKGVATLMGKVYVSSRGRYCPAHPEIVYVSAAAGRVVLPGTSYGLDVLVRIGCLRDGERRTMGEIVAELPAHIKVSERHLRNLYKEYLALLSCAERLDVEKLKEAASHYGGLILSVDGLEPEGGQPQLWVVRELLTNTVLAAGWLPRVDEGTLTAFLEPVKALDLPWLATVSDKQVSLINALNATWEGLPHQYCQAHYLCNAVTPIYDADEHMKTQMRKQVRAKAGVIMRETQAAAKKQKQGNNKSGLVITGLAVNPPPGLEAVKVAAEAAKKAQEEPCSDPLPAETSAPKTTPLTTVEEVLSAYAGTDQVVRAGRSNSQAKTDHSAVAVAPSCPPNRQQQIDKLVEAYAARLRTTLSSRGRKPFRLAGLRLYSDLLALLTSLENSLVSLPDEPRLTCFAEAIRGALLTFEDEYEALAEGYSWVLDISDILDKKLPQLEPPLSDKPLSSHQPDEPDKPLSSRQPDDSEKPDKPLSDIVKDDLDAYLTRLEQRSDLNDTLLTFRRHLRNLTDRYAPGLFQCYDIPGLPRTNNDTESLFGRLRRQTNRTSGAHHAKQRLQEQGAWLLFDLPANEDEHLRRLQHVPLKEWRNERQRMHEHLDSFCQDRRFRSKSAAYLAQLEAHAAAVPCAY